MKDPIDIQQLRKKRQRQTRLKQLSVLFIIAIGIIGALYLNDKFVRSDITTQIGGIVESTGGEGFPTELPSGSVRNIDKIKDSIIILKDSNLYVYNNKGKQIENVQRTGERTVVKTNNDRLIYYDIGGTKLTVHSGTGKVYELDELSKIISAHVGKSGEVAVLTSPPNSVAELKVYNRTKSEAIYTRTFTKDLVSDVVVSPKGAQVAVVSFGNNGGVIDFRVLVYPLDKDVEPLEIPLADRLIIDVAFVDEDTVSVLTDRDFMIFDSHKGTLLSSYTFSDNTTISNFAKNNNDLLLLNKDNDNNEYILSFVDSNATNISNLRIGSKPLDFTFNSNRIYLLDNGKIKEYNRELNLIEEYPGQNIVRIYCLEDKLYLLYKNEIAVLEKKEEVS